MATSSPQSPAPQYSTLNGQGIQHIQPIPQYSMEKAAPMVSAQPQQHEHQEPQPHRMSQAMAPGMQQALMQPQQIYGQPQYVGQPQMVQSAGGVAFRTSTPLNVLGRMPAPADCPACGTRSMTRITREIGNSNHLWAGITFLVTGVCCFIPYMVNDLKDVNHRCGHCGVLLATWHKSGVVDVHQYA